MLVQRPIRRAIVFFAAVIVQTRHFLLDLFANPREILSVRPSSLLFDSQKKKKQFLLTKSRKEHLWNGEIYEMAKSPFRYLYNAKLVKWLNHPRNPSTDSRRISHERNRRMEAMEVRNFNPQPGGPLPPSPSQGHGGSGAYTLPAARFSSEDILFCIDVGPETMAEMKVNGPNGRPYTRLDSIKQAIMLFVHAKLTINPDHRFAFTALSKSTYWVLNYSFLASSSSSSSFLSFFCCFLL